MNQILSREAALPLRRLLLLSAYPGAPIAARYLSLAGEPMYGVAFLYRLQKKKCNSSIWGGGVLLCVTPDLSHCWDAARA